MELDVQAGDANQRAELSAPQQRRHLGPASA